MKTLSRLIPMLVLFATFSACAPKGLPFKSLTASGTNISSNEFLTVAMYNGLLSDRFPHHMADDILGLPGAYFVTKCPICRPVEAGLQAYADTEMMAGKVRTPEDILERLFDENQAVQQEAFRDLVNRYTQAEMKRLKLSEEAKASLMQQLEEDRKRGMALKRDDFGKFCPSCDGACDVKE